MTLFVSRMRNVLNVKEVFSEAHSAFIESYVIDPEGNNITLHEIEKKKQLTALPAKASRTYQFTVRIK